MIVYSATKAKFLDDVLSNNIENIIHTAYQQRTNGRRVGPGEIASWRNSMLYVNNLLVDEEIPMNTGVFVEYLIQQSTKRVDLLLSGIGEDDRRNLILVELKQWSEAEVTELDGIVRTRFSGGITETNHPSYQAWSYASLLEDFNEVVYEGSVNVYPCVYAHNFVSEGVLDDPRYDYYVQRAPLFLKQDAIALRNFIKKYIRKGDNGQLLFDVENGRIRPSKMLADKLSSMLKGKEEFIMIDDQKLVLEKALALIELGQQGAKQVYIVEGGPGTGKSVVAVNLLVKSNTSRHLSAYVTRNAAPRAVYEKKLTGTFRRTAIHNLFKGAGSFHKTDPNTFDLLVVDEAHRLNEKSGLYSNEGINQVMEMIRSSKTTVFFLDENQRVTLKDIGSKEVIQHWARELGAEIHIDKLASQFRCNGSDGYLAWLDNTLQIRDTANQVLAAGDFEFNIFDSPSDLRDHIFERNRINNKARMVAGYCWDWKSKSNQLAFDIQFPGTDFSAQWNLTQDGSLWIIAEHSVQQVGCIHTCQGLEVDHIGVIVGPDLLVRDGRVITDGRARSRMDKSVHGFKGMYKRDPVQAQAAVEPIIKNTYRTLMTRGMKSCSVYFTDPETKSYFVSAIESQ